MLHTMLLVLATFLAAVSAELKFASYYGDHMVLQRGPQRAVIWGTGTLLNDQVKVQLQGGTIKMEVSTKVQKNPDGAGYMWKVKLPEIRDTFPFNITASSKEGQIVISDVLFGDVWICSGQSNMGFTMSNVFNSSLEIAKALTFKNIRVFKVGLETSVTPLDDLKSVATPWSLPTTASIPSFSAVCWLYAEYIYPTLNYPIGLVESAWGGTPIEAWSSPEALKKCTPPGERGPGEKSVLWNAMINPLLDMTIYGAIWYQGEANAGKAALYACQFPAMIEDWRSRFNMKSEDETRKDFPFGFVQLAANAKNPDVVGGFPGLRWSQTANFGYVPNDKMIRTFMAVAMDLPDFDSPSGSIHPRDKQDVCLRLALSGRAIAYGDKQVEFQGPFPASFKIIASKQIVVITYNKGEVPFQIRSASGFEVCCNKDSARCSDESEWKPAEIGSKTTNTINISFNKVCQQNGGPSGVRYAWRESPCLFKLCPVYGTKTDLPAPPFIKLGIS